MDNVVVVLVYCRYVAVKAMKQHFSTVDKVSKHASRAFEPGLDGSGAIPSFFSLYWD